jgi:hypothetical protein
VGLRADDRHGGAAPVESVGAARRESARAVDWTTLRRWGRAARDGSLWRCVHGEPHWTLMQCAERATLVIVALADVTIGPPERRAFAGVVHAH